MNYWWVNHKQTFKREFEGGFIWSPQTNSDGSFNQTYLNLTETRPGDIVFSFADALIKAVGVVERPYQDANKPSDFGAINQWNEIGYRVDISWAPLFHPFKPKERIEAIRDLLPNKYSPIQKTGDGNQKFYLASISNELGSRVIDFIQERNIGLRDALEDLKKSIDEEELEESILNQGIDDTEKDQLIKARIGQGVFRNRVLDIESQCRVTGVSDKRFLTASHIKPWRISSNVERLDGNNGLILSPHIDKLFDKGWMSFTDAGDVLLTNRAISKIAGTWKIPLGNVGVFNDSQIAYLSFHRDKIYRRE